jgi:hypothetical protein
MRWSFALAAFVAAAAAGALLPALVRAQNASPLSGVWALNRSMSDLPKDIGFNPSWMTASSKEGQSGGSNGGGRGRRGSGAGGDRSTGAGPFSARQESYEDAQRIQLLTAEARNPPARLILVDNGAAIIITNELGQSRTLHPDGREESVNLQEVPFRVTSTRDGNQLAVVYRVDQTREVRYTYSNDANPPRLVVDVQFLERGAGDKARFVYEPGLATETAAPPAGRPVPASGQPTTETFDQRPGAELKGLASLGILVEDLSAQAVACGLSHDTIEGALSKRLASAGLTVRRNSDDDTYVYVNIMTTNLPGGMCVSRYDAFLYTHGTAKLSYREQPVLVQISLMHRGGIDIGAPTGHGVAVERGLEKYVDLFVTQIHDANK